MPESIQIIEAEDLVRRAHAAPFGGPMLDIAADRALRVIGIAVADIEEVTLVLRRVYPSDHPVFTRPLEDGRFEIEVAPVADTENWRSAQRLHAIIGYLRSPDGCPWDRAQDWGTLAPKVLEEAYEVVDAIAEGDPAELAGELGDLLLLVAMLAQMAEERGAFMIEDVYELVNRKLIRRHPHVFGDDAADTPEAVLSTWQRIKREERGESSAPRSKYDRLPRSMPGIAKAAAMLDQKPGVTSHDKLPSGEQLLRTIESMISLGRDPEAELQAALDRKYKSN